MLLLLLLLLLFFVLLFPLFPLLLLFPLFPLVPFFPIFRYSLCFLMLPMFQFFPCSPCFPLFLLVSILSLVSILFFLFQAPYRTFPHPKTRQNKIETKDEIKPQHLHFIVTVVWKIFLCQGSCGVNQGVSDCGRSNSKMAENGTTLNTKFPSIDLSLIYVWFYCPARKLIWLVCFLFYLGNLLTQENIAEVLTEVSPLIGDGDLHISQVRIALVRPLQALGPNSRNARGGTAWPWLERLREESSMAMWVVFCKRIGVIYLPVLGLSLKDGAGDFPRRLSALPPAFFIENESEIETKRTSWQFHSLRTKCTHPATLSNFTLANKSPRINCLNLI